MKVRKAVLMAAGKGKRLGALTADRPKPMVPVAGVPVLERIVNGLRGAGVDQFQFVIGHFGQVIEDYFGDGSRWDARFSYVWQTEIHGTAAALKHGREFAGDDAIVGGYGDILTDVGNYKGIVGDFEEEPCAALVGINLSDVSVGAAITLDGRRMTSIIEKPPAGTAMGPWNQSGLSVYGPAIWPALDSVQLSPRGEYELTDAIAWLIAQGEVVRGHKLQGLWSDVGTPQALAEAEEALGGGG